jgi:hypothetical protein
MKTLREKITAQCDNMQKRYLNAVDLKGPGSEAAVEYFQKWKRAGDDLDTLIRLETKYESCP